MIIPLPLLLSVICNCNHGDGHCVIIHYHYYQTADPLQSNIAVEYVRVPEPFSVLTNRRNVYGLTNSFSFHFLLFHCSECHKYYMGVLWSDYL